MIRRNLMKGALAIPGLAFSRRADAAAAAAGEFPQSPGLTRSVAEFIVRTTSSDLPAGLQALAKKSILDGFGLALAGSVSPLAPLVQRYLGSLELCGGKATVVGSKMKTAPRFAAFANGISIHADDYDDTQLSQAKDRIYGLLTHPTVPVLPPAFAQCETSEASGKDLLLAYQVGVEVECKVAEAIMPRHYQQGFHSTATCGSIGAAAAAARLTPYTG